MFFDIVGKSGGEVHLKSVDQEQKKGNRTMKVRLPEDWKGASATQDDKAIEVIVVEHDRARFALVEAVPDRGDVCLTPSAGDAAPGLAAD